MSRTRHARPRKRRTDPTIAGKKPDEGRRWMRRNVHPFSRAPRDVRQDEPAELESELDE